MTANMPLTRVCLLAVLLASLLGACADTAPETPADATAVLPTEENRAVPLETSAAGVQTAVPAAPAPAATVAPAAPAGPPLVGPEWTVIASGDANADGRRDVIAYKPAGVAPRQPDPAYPLAASEVAIVQEGVGGQPELQFTMTPQQITIPNQQPITYPALDPLTTPAAFLLNVAPAGPVPLTTIPLNASGDTFMQGIGVAWNRDALGYRLVAGGRPQPTTTPPQPNPPLVGNEWTIAAAGDVNADGRRDVIAYKPVAIIPRRPDATFPVLASEIVIVQEGAAGPEILLMVTPGQISASGQTLLGYGGAPAGFMVNTAAGGAVPVTVIPLSAGGDAIAPRAELLWSRDEQAYRLTARSQPPPAAPPPLVGNEWTVAAAGDVNADGRRDVIAYKPAPITPRRPDPAYPLIASEVVIVQEGASGGPELQLAINPRQITVPNQTLLIYPAGDPATTPAAFQMNVAVGTGLPLSIIPLNANGDNYTQGVGVTWSRDQQGYRLVAGGQPLPTPGAAAPPPAPTTAPTIPPPAAATVPPAPTSPPVAPPTSVPTSTVVILPTGAPAVAPTTTAMPVGPQATQPLVGSEWTVAASGDINADGRRDVIAYKPATVAPKLHNLLYPLVASEVVIVQEGAGGTPELLLAVSPQQIVAPNQTLLTFPSGDPATTPAAFQVRVTPSDPVPLSVLPLNANGDNYTQPSGITWNRDQQGYRLASGR